MKAIRPKVDAEFASLLDPLRPEEYAELKKKIEEEKAVIPLIVWKEKNILVDGHNRLKIYDELGIDEYPVEMMDFIDRDDVENWIINNQLAQRNLSDERRAYFRGKEYLRIRKKRGDTARFDSPLAQTEPMGETTEKVGEKHNVSKATIKRDSVFARAVDSIPSVDRQPLLNGQISKTATMTAASGKDALCDRCKRLGNPVRNCPNCAVLKTLKLTRPIPTTRKPEPSTQGKQTFDWKGFDMHLGYVARGPDALAKAYPDKSKDHGKAVDLLEEFTELWKAWQKKITGSK